MQILTHMCVRKRKQLKILKTIFFHDLYIQNINQDFDYLHLITFLIYIQNINEEYDKILCF